MLLPPGERLAQELAGLVQVEISGPQEAQDVLILRNLKRQQDLKIGLKSIS